MKILFIICNFGIGTLLSISYDERRRPRWDAPAAVLGTENAKNHHVPPCLGEALRREALPNMNFNDFYDFVVNVNGSCLLQGIF
jgi:hypothetical protein